MPDFSDDKAGEIARHYGVSRPDRNGTWRINCPVHGGDGRNLLLNNGENGRGVKAACTTGPECSYQDIRAKVLQDTGIDINPPRFHEPPGTEFRLRDAIPAHHGPGCGPTLRWTGRGFRLPLRPGRRGTHPRERRPGRLPAVETGRRSRHLRRDPERAGRLF